MLVLLLSLFVPLAGSLGAPADVLGSGAPLARTAAAGWAAVAEDGTLRLERGRTVAFRGTGHLEFGADRTRVRAEPEPLRAFVNGVRVRGRQALTDADVLDLRAADGTAWAVRLASESEVGEVGGATRIRDDRPDGPARIDADEPTRFFLRIVADGGSTSIHPETD